MTDTTTNHADAGLVPGLGGHRGELAAVAVDLGSGQARLWSVGDGIRAVPTAGEAFSRSAPLVRRGRIMDVAGCVTLLTRLLHTVTQGLPAGPVVVACRPVLAALSGAGLAAMAAGRQSAAVAA